MNKRILYFKNGEQRLDVDEFNKQGGGRLVLEHAMKYNPVHEKWNVMSYREAFEDAYAKEIEYHPNDHAYTFTRDGHGYLVGHTNRAWKMWCEAIRYEIFRRDGEV